MPPITPTPIPSAPTPPSFTTPVAPTVKDGVRPGETPEALRVPVDPAVLEEVTALVEDRRSGTSDRAARHAEMLSAVQHGFAQLFGRSVTVQVGDGVLIEGDPPPSPLDDDPHESTDRSDDVWAERLRADASAKVPTDAQRRAGAIDRRWFMVVLVQGAMGHGLPNVDQRPLDQVLDMARVRAAAPMAQVFRARQGPWADVANLYGHAPRLLVQGQAALDALLASGGPDGDLLFHPDLRAFRVRNRRQRHSSRAADLYYYLQVVGPLAATLPERAHAWRQAATAQALAEPLREVSGAIGTARNALACLVDLQQVVLDPVRSADHPGYAFDAGADLTDAWRAPLDRFLAQAMSIRAHLETLHKAEQSAQAQVRRALGKTVDGPF